MKKQGFYRINGKAMWWERDEVFIDPKTRQPIPCVHGLIENCSGALFYLHDVVDAVPLEDPREFIKWIKQGGDWKGDVLKNMINAHFADLKKVLEMDSPSSAPLPFGPTLATGE